MIGTPSYDGRLDVWYVNSLMSTILVGRELGIEVIPVWVSFDSLVQRARNDTIAIALESGVDCLVFIDSDIEWTPDDFFKLVLSGKDVIGGTYRKKSDEEQYVLKIGCESKVDEFGLLKVAGLGTGFMKISRQALLSLWAASEPYIDPKDNSEKRLVCNVVVDAGDLVSEDIHMCRQLSYLGYDVYLNTTITCNHVGTKKFTGNFSQWYESL